jgi:hypothetical protein
MELARIDDSFWIVVKISVQVRYFSCLKGIMTSGLNWVKPEPNLK